MELKRQTIKESIEEWKAPKTEGNKKISLIESRSRSIFKPLKEAKKEEKEEDKLPDVVSEEPIVVPTEPTTEETPVEDNNIGDEATSDKEKIDGLYSSISNCLKDKFGEIDQIKGLVATINYLFPEGNYNDIISLLNNISDDANIHIGLYQKALEILDPEATRAMEDGKDKADEIIANKDPKDSEEKSEDKTTDKGE